MKKKESMSSFFHNISVFEFLKKPSFIWKVLEITPADFIGNEQRLFVHVINYYFSKILQLIIFLLVDITLSIYLDHCKNWAF